MPSQQSPTGTQGALGVYGVSKKLIPENVWITDSTVITPSAGFGTPAFQTYMIRREGDSLRIRGCFTSGTRSVSTAYLQLTGYTIDWSKVIGPTGVTGVQALSLGTWVDMVAAAQQIDATTNFGFVFVDGVNSNQVFLAWASVAGTFRKDNANASGANGSTVQFEFSLPVNEFAQVGV